MKHWIYKLKVWMIHKLGGYTADEATPNRKIRRLNRMHIYTDDMLMVSLGNVHVREHGKALQFFVDGLKPFVRIEEHFDPSTRKWTLRTSLRVVDDDLI